MEPSQSQIAERARALWRERGSPGGRDLEHWLEAEQQLREEMKSRGQAHRKSSGVDQDDQDLDAAERRLDGLVKRPLSPEKRTPSGEQL